MDRAFNQIDRAVVNQVDYVVNWRQEEITPSDPSAIIELDVSGKIKVLRQ